MLFPHAFFLYHACLNAHLRFVDDGAFLRGIRLAFPYKSQEHNILQYKMNVAILSTCGCSVFDHFFVITAEEQIIRRNTTEEGKDIIPFLGLLSSLMTGFKKQEASIRLKWRPLVWGLGVRAPSEVLKNTSNKKDMLHHFSTSNMSTNTNTVTSQDPQPMILSL